MTHAMQKLSLVAALFVAAAGGAMAQEITLKYASFLPATHPSVTEASKVLMDSLAKSVGNKVKVEFFPAEQAGKALQLLDLVKSGAVDMADVSTGYISSDKAPLLGVWEIPGAASSACKAAQGIRPLGAPGGLIYQSDLAPNNIRILTYLAYPPYGPAASGKPIRSVDDLKGMKMRSAGGLMERTVGKLGGAPVKLPSPEIFQALQRGTLDTVLFSFLSVKQYDLASVAKYGATGYSLGTPGTLVVINERKFKSLPADVQKALEDAGLKGEQSWCNYVDNNELKIKAELEAKGMQIYTWSAADKAKLDELLADVTTEWAKSLDQRGKPGTKVLEAFKKAAAAN